MISLSEIRARLRKPRNLGNGSFLALCPAHVDEEQSLHVGPGPGCYCYGCGVYGPLWKLDMLLNGVSPDYFEREVSARNKEYSSAWFGQKTIDEVYNYYDEKRRHLYQVVRYIPKDFRQRRMHPSLPGRWIWSIKGVRRVPYRLPDILRRKNEVVILVEGEKDADRLHKLGYLATTISGGINGWKHADTRSFTNRCVVIIPDNDEPGLIGACNIERDLAGRARYVNVLRLDTSEPGADVTDWLKTHTKEELECLLRERVQSGLSGSAPVQS
jgi:putative DNA primase/helicase